MFAQRLAGHSVARIARALNEAGLPCPSAADPARNPHRPGTAWTLGAVTSILGNPRYTGRQVWNRQRTDTELADPADIALGHRQVQRWNLPDGWVISARPAHPGLVSEDKILTRLPALHSLLTRPRQPGAGAAARGRRRTRAGTDINAPANTGDIISYLREHHVTLTWDQAAATLRAGTPQAITIQAS
jgi:hypothetical protein